ncbi:unnamed protein product [Rotaria socialis]|uniref:Uncharacterized protein n=1 Tax=Rotaria socialis TaxID=392032 RepID=A0A817ZUC2_9BILA|nr:unnamed protein product [Rotaria socialis]CAF3395645.1 unnamed protein product [Rotaria socialis]CAF4591400.1 unnamed protein product [Rotaria socialis]CAF4851580.1 unnamed protein product [Rotaria socialis]
MCRSYSDDFKKSSSSPPPLTHQQYINPPPPPLYTTTSPYTLEGSVGFIEAMSVDLLPSAVLQQLAAIVADQASRMGAGVGTVPASAVSAASSDETPALPSSQ